MLKAFVFLISQNIQKYEPDMTPIRMKHKGRDVRPAIDFIEKCLQKQPEDRPSISELLNDDDWLADYARKTECAEDQML